LRPRIAQYIVVLSREVARRQRGDLRFHFADDDPVDGWISGERPSEYPRAETHYENGFGFRRQGGKVAQHALHAHVLPGIGCFDTATDMELHGTAGDVA